MKILGCFCLILCIFDIFAEDADKNTGSGPTIFSDISESAREEAVSFDGIHGLLGLCLTPNEFEASYGRRDNFTRNNMNLLSICCGIEYAKALRNGLLIAINADLNLSGKGKKEGTWGDLNKEYESQRGQLYPGKKTGKLEKDSLSPSVNMKLGYQLPKYNSMAYLILGLKKTSGSYKYIRNGGISDVSFNAYQPSVGLGWEKKINPEFGASVEAIVVFKKGFEEQFDNSVHHVKAAAKTVRLVAILRCASND
ncbi:MAG: hypothetical protein LBB25_03140 [Holosporaceae bacterium]|jgi:hypothetical protein|nr:hypothetical protein [Holosporaceae bacterium]